MPFEKFIETADMPFLAAEVTVASATLTFPSKGTVATCWPAALDEITSATPAMMTTATREMAAMPHLWAE
jgi:hypothetical protein